MRQLTFIKGESITDLQLGYEFEWFKGLQLTGGVNNVFDEDYFIRVRNNGWATPGEARSAVLSATYRF